MKWRKIPTRRTSVPAARSRPADGTYQHARTVRMLHSKTLARRHRPLHAIGDRLRQNVVDHVAMHVGQSAVGAIVPDGQSAVVDSQ